MISAIRRNILDLFTASHSLSMACKWIGNSCTHGPPRTWLTLPWRLNNEHLRVSEIKVSRAGAPAGSRFTEMMTRTRSHINLRHPLKSLLKKTWVWRHGGKLGAPQPDNLFRPLFSSSDTHLAAAHAISVRSFILFSSSQFVWHQKGLSSSALNF